jgi:hypothetical protein
MKEAAFGLGALAFGGHAMPAFAGEHRSRGCALTGDIGKLASDAQAGDLVSSALKAARAQVEYSRATAAGRRAVALLGEGAGREHEARAEILFKARVAHLRSLKGSLARFSRSTDQARASRAAEFFASGGLRELTAQARQESILRLLDSELSPEEATNAVKSLDATLQRVQGAKSAGELTALLDQHLDELLAKKMGNPSIPQGLCILILIITSVFMVLVIIAALICAFSFGLACEGVLDKLLADACEPS